MPAAFVCVCLFGGFAWFGFFVVDVVLFCFVFKKME